MTLDYDYEKGQGALTPDDRRYLNGVLEYTGENARQKRYARREGIRDRVEAAVTDFLFIWFMEPKQRQKLFTDMEPDSQLYLGLRKMVAFAMLAGMDAGIDPETVLTDAADLVYSGYAPDDSPGPSLEPANSGSVTGERRVIHSVDVNIEKDIRTIPNTAELKERWLEGEELSTHELGQLLSTEYGDELERLRNAERPSTD